MIYSRIQTSDGQLLVDPPLENLQEWATENGTSIWLDLVAPTMDELEMIAGIFHLMHLTVEDLVDQKQRAKLEHFDHGDYTVLVMHGLTFDQQTGQITTPELDAVFGKEFLITAHQPDLAVLQDDRHTPEDQCQRIGKSPSYALYTAVDRLVDGYFPILDIMDDAIDNLEDQIMTNPTPDVLQRIFTLKRSLGHARKVISPQLEVFNRMIARDEEYLDPHTVVYYRDVYDHLVRTFEVIDSYGT